MPTSSKKDDPFDIFDDDDEGWQDMPVVRDDDEFAGGLDEEDQKKYKYVAPLKKDQAGAGNATGNLLDVDDYGQEWRDKQDQNESEYTRLRINEEDDQDEVHLRTKYLFDEDKAMTPLSQMQATKNMLTEAQRIAYVGLCHLAGREMSQRLRDAKSKELKDAIQSMDLWALKIMGRLYYHMEVATEEQKMIESLALHGVQPMDLVPALMTTHTVANPEYDPAEARRQADESKQQAFDASEDIAAPPAYTPSAATAPVPPAATPIPSTPSAKNFQTTARVLEESSTVAMPGVSTSLSAADAKVTLDIRWTVLCDLFLMLIADSVYDARSRVLLENVALKLGLGWVEVVKFERRVTEALEIQESVEKIEQKEVIEGRQKSSKKRRYMMVGLATLGGGLVIGLSAGLLAPVIGAGLGTALATVGIGGTSTFLAGAGGAAVITTGGVLTGSGIAARGMARRTQLVRTFDLLPLHNNKRVNCIITVPGFLTGLQDDPRLPFSILDPLVGDVFSVLWEPEMIRETGDALKILTGEVLSQLAQTALQATVMTALMSALQWPIILTKLGYLIDNPWNNALDRAKAAGGVLADVLIHRHLGVRPITLIGFSLGARVIFYALLELARQKAFGIVQDVIILGTTVTASRSTWHQARSAVSGRFVNGYSRNDWVLNYLFRATSGGLASIAGLRPVEGVPGLENVDVTDKVAGHMSYRTFMPLILDSLGFPVTADYFDEPEEPDFTEERVVVREEDLPKKKGWFGRNSKKPTSPSSRVSRPPSASSFPSFQKARPSTESTVDEDLPPRLETAVGHTGLPAPSHPERSTTPAESGDLGDPAQTPDLPARAGFDFGAIKAALGKHDLNEEAIPAPRPNPYTLPPRLETSTRAGSAPPPFVEGPDSPPRPPSHDTPLNLVDPSNSRGDLSTAFSRSMSLNNINQVSDMSSFGERSAQQNSTPSPPLDFGGSLWSAESATTGYPYSAFGSTAFNDSAAGLAGSSSIAPAHRSTQLGRFDPSPLPDSYALAESGPALSFGEADGSVTPFAPSSSAQDLWSSKKPRQQSLNSNPWS